MIESLHSRIILWLNEMGQLVKERMAEGISVETKTSLSDLVTNVDKEIEERFIAYIQENYPTHSVLGEETFGKYDINKSGYVWVIDPIDGTMNFVKEQKNFAIMLALYCDGIGQLAYIFDVMNDELFYAIKGQGAYCNTKKLDRLADLELEESLLSMSILCYLDENHRKFEPLIKTSQGVRMIGSAAHSVLAIFKGHHNAYIADTLKPWDYMAALVFANELGAVYSTVNGEPLPLWETTPFVMATPKVLQRITGK